MHDFQTRYLSHSALPGVCRPAMSTDGFGAGHAAANGPAGGARVWFEGEVHNLPELRAELNLAGDEPAAQVLWAAWQRWGERLGEHLDGVFALALADAERLLLVRDASGLRGLYVDTKQPGGPWFGSALDARVPASDAQREIAPAALHEYLRLGDICAPRTIWRNVSAIEPGVPWRLDGRGLHPAADGAPTRTPVPAPSFDAAVERLDALLHEAVARRLGDAERPAAFLSGGIDSALICAVATRCTPRPVAVTVGFEGEGFDEAPVAARIAGHLGLEHRVLRFGRSECLAAFERLARGMDQPMADPATMATLLAFEHCREHFDVVLDGTGADEAVGAMPPRHARLAVGVGSLVPQPVRRALVALMRRVPGLAGYTPLLDFEHPAEVLMRWKGFTRAEIEALCAEPVMLEGTAFHRTFARFARGAHYERYTALYGVMPSDRLTQAARLAGLGVRYPFFARDVDGFLRQLPTPWRHLPGQPKRILAALLARYVPREIWDRPKQGFNFPLHDFLAADGYALVRRHVLEGRWLGRGILRADRVQRHARQYMGGERGLMFRVWALVVLGAWLDAHEDVAVPARRA